MSPATACQEQMPERKRVSGRPASRSTVFSTPWFELVARTEDPYTEQSPHYSIACPDYVTSIAQTPNGDLVMVRQFRPAVQETTLEFPSGHIEAGETPLEAAARELYEETGFAGNGGRILGCLRPDTGRLGNRLWVAAFSNVSHVGQSPHQDPFEIELEVLQMSVPAVLEHISCGEFSHALNLAPLLLALQWGGLGFQISPVSK